LLTSLPRTRRSPVRRSRGRLHSTRGGLRVGIHEAHARSSLDTSPSAEPAGASFEDSTAYPFHLHGNFFFAASGISNLVVPISLISTVVVRSGSDWLPHDVPSSGVVPFTPYSYFVRMPS